MDSQGDDRNRQELAAARSEAAALRAELQAAQEKIAWLESRLEELLRALFGRKSETSGRASDESAADEPGDDSQPPAGGRHDSKKRGKKRGRKRGTPNPGRVGHADLPVRDELLDLPEHERCCPSCGKAYVRSGTEDSWLYEMDWQAVARRIRRQQYRPTCSCAEARSVLAPPAPRLGERTQLGTSVWGWCLVQVFCLFRAQADETSWPVQYIEGQDNGKEVPQGGGKPLYWLWTCLTADTVRMRILPTRGSPSGEQLPGNLGGTGTDREYPEVVVVCDRWSACKALARKSSGRIVLQFCWANVALKAMLRGSSFCLTVNDSARNSRNIRF